MIFSVPRGLVDRVEPEIGNLASDPELWAHYTQWSESRGRSLEDLPKPG
jgi:hypothetical protein